MAADEPFELVDLERPTEQAGGQDEAVSSGAAATDDWQFHVGVAISVYQNSGGANNQWETFERQK